MLDKIVFIPYNNKCKGQEIQERKDKKMMTKLEMLKVIEKSGMVIDFSFSYLMKKSRAQIERLYQMSLEYEKKKLTKA